MDEIFERLDRENIFEHGIQNKEDAVHVRKEFHKIMDEVRKIVHDYVILKYTASHDLEALVETSCHRGTANFIELCLLQYKDCLKKEYIKSINEKYSLPSRETFMLYVFYDLCGYEYGVSDLSNEEIITWTTKIHAEKFIHFSNTDLLIPENYEELITLCKSKELGKSMSLLDKAKLIEDIRDFISLKQHTDPDFFPANSSTIDPHLRRTQSHFEQNNSIIETFVKNWDPVDFKQWKKGHDIMGEFSSVCEVTFMKKFYGTTLVVTFYKDAPEAEEQQYLFLNSDYCRQGFWIETKIENVEPVRILPKTVSPREISPSSEKKSMFDLLHELLEIQRETLEVQKETLSILRKE